MTNFYSIHRSHILRVHSRAEKQRWIRKVHPVAPQKVLWQLQWRSNNLKASDGWGCVMFQTLLMWPMATIGV